MISSDRYLRAAVGAVKVSFAMNTNERREAMEKLAGKHLANAVRAWSANSCPAAVR